MGTNFSACALLSFVATTILPFIGESPIENLWNVLRQSHTFTSQTTSVAFSFRIETVMNSDRVLVMENGKVR